jgi:hypothetical protein
MVLLLLLPHLTIGRVNGEQERWCGSDGAGVPGKVPIVFEIPHSTPACSGPMSSMFAQ